MALALTLTLDDRVIGAAFDGLDRALGDMTELMDQIGSALIAGASERIGTTNLAPSGAPWTPSKRVRKRGGKTLMLSGLLRQSIVAQAGPASVEVGTNVPYARIHQEGGTIEREARIGEITRRRDAETGKVGQRFVKRGSAGAFSELVSVGAHDIKMPARPFLGVSVGEEATIGELAAAWLGQAAGGGA